MLIDTAIEVFIKYTNVLSVVLTHLPVTRRSPACFSFCFFLPKFRSSWILFKFFPQIRVVDVCPWYDYLVPCFSLSRLLSILNTPTATVSRLTHHSLPPRSLIKDFLLIRSQLLYFLLESFIFLVLVQPCLSCFHLQITNLQYELFVSAL